MSDKIFVGFIAAAVLGIVGFAVLSNGNEQSAQIRPGVEQPDKGQKHVAEGSLKYGGAIPPTSGEHASNVPWQVYKQEVPDVNTIHNLEHGGIVIAYRPDLPVDQIAKIEALFSKPYSRKSFSPIKAIVVPRAANGVPIIMSSWTRNLQMQTYDEEQMIEFYMRNVGKAPEGTVA